LTLPNNQGFPSGFRELFPHRYISGDITFELWNPILGSGLGRSSIGATRVLVPKAAVNEDYLSSACEGEVRFAR
jgi:hypothetical protein